MRLRLLVAIGLWLSLCSSCLQAEEFSGKVVGVSDGDTITVMRDGTGVKVRLYGVDCPEKRQPFGAKAKKFTSQLSFGKLARVDVVGNDKYQRSIGKVMIGSVNLNEELVRNGMAWWFRKYAPNDSILESLETEARSQRIGLWRESAPIAPWEYRKTQ